MASGYKSDAQGFLVGEVIENGRDVLRLQTQSYGVLKDIRSDVRAIGRAVGAEVASAVRASRPGAAQRSVASTGVRIGSGNYAGGRRDVVATTVSRPAPTQRSGAVSRTVAVTQPRAVNGRFVAGGRRPDGGASAFGGGERGGSAVMSKLSDSMGKLANSLSAVDNVDPTLNAAKEVRDVVVPLGRGLNFMFGRTAERKKEVWYRRILKALTPARNEQRSGAVVAGGGGGLFGPGGPGGILGGLLGAAGGGAAGALGALLGRGKGLLRKVPLLGAILAGGSALFSAFGGDDDPAALPAQNRARRYHNTGQAVGMGTGAIAGGFLGSFLGPLGTAGGAWLGSLIGDKVGGAVGDWTKALVDADVPGKMIEEWKVTTAAIGAAWDSLTTDAKEAWAGITTKAGEWLDAAKSGLDVVGSTLASAGSALNGWIKEKTGVDVKSAVSKAANAVGDAAGAAWDKAKDVASAGWSAAKGYGSDALDAAGRSAAALVPAPIKRAYSAGAAAAAQAKAGYDVARGTENATGSPVGAMQRGARRAGGSLGDLVAKGEGDYGSFNRGVAGDARGAKMDFATMTVAEIMAAQALPKRDANRLFAVGKYQTIPSTLKGAVAAMGLKGDEKFTPELQERIFAEYLTDKKRPEIAGYVKGEHDNLSAARRAGAREWASIADPVTGKSYYAGSAGNAASLSAGAFGDSLVGARGRYKALVAGGMDSKSAYAAVVASPNIPPVRAAAMPSSAPTNIPRPPEVKEPVVPLDSLGGVPRRERVQVSLAEVIGQDVGDRDIAHIVSGGLGMR